MHKSGSQNGQTGGEQHGANRRRIMQQCMLCVGSHAHRHSSFCLLYCTVAYPSHRLQASTVARLLYNTFSRLAMQLSTASAVLLPSPFSNLKSGCTIHMQPCRQRGASSLLTCSGVHGGAVHKPLLLEVPACRWLPLSTDNVGKRMKLACDRCHSCISNNPIAFSSHVSSSRLVCRILLGACREFVDDD